MKQPSPILVLGLFVTVSFTLATSLELRVGKWTDRTQSEGAFKKLLGDGRRMFANQFVDMAEVYLHSGYYPSIFDRRDVKASKVINNTTQEHDEHGHEAHSGDESKSEHEREMDFLGQPHDWLERFIRRFRITKHTHLEGAEEREVLPWLKLAIDLDPQMVQTYVSTAFWLRKQLGRVNDAEEVLREGVRNNPASYEILFELGRLYNEDRHDTNRARNVWVLGLRRWNAQSAEAKAESMQPYGELTVNLGRLEDAAGNFQRAIQFLEMAKQVSPNPAALQAQIDEIQAKISAAPPPPPPPSLVPP